MATVLYIDPNQTSGLPRAAALGCGWLPSVPPQYTQAVVSLPSVVVAGQGIVTGIPDNPPTTAAAIGTALAPILTAEQAARDAVVVGSANQSTLQQQSLAALTANRNDQTQDGTIQTGAATINGTAGPFTLTQCTTFIKQLATAVSTLAGNDVNAKKELNALIRLALQQFDATN